MESHNQSTIEKKRLLNRENILTSEELLKKNVPLYGKKAKPLKISYITGKPYKSKHNEQFMYRKLLVIFTLFSISSGFQEISPDTLVQWLMGNAPSDFILIDLREKNELTTIIGSGNCGAYNFPYKSKVFEKIVEKLPKDTMIILYCARGNRSKEAAEEFDSEFSNILSLTGGMESWKGPTLPGDKIKSSDLFPEVNCVPVTVLLPKKLKSSPVKNSLTDKRINLQGKVCNAVSSGMHINTNKRIIFFSSKNHPN